jgi:hypothetical protein
MYNIFLKLCELIAATSVAKLAVKDFGYLLWA